MRTININEIETFDFSLTENGIGVTGIAMKLYIQRVSDGKWWDGDSWEVAVTQLSMTEVDSTNLKGLYRYTALPTASMSIGDRYNIRYYNADATYGVNVAEVVGVVLAQTGDGYALLNSGTATTKVSVGTGAGQINVASGKVPSTIAAGDIATDAITAASVKADAVTKIQNGLAIDSTVSKKADTDLLSTQASQDLIKTRVDLLSTQASVDAGFIAGSKSAGTKGTDAISDDIAAIASSVNTFVNLEACAYEFDFSTYAKAVMLFYQEDRPFSGDPYAWCYVYNSTGGNPTTSAEIVKRDTVVLWATAEPS